MICLTQWTECLDKASAMWSHGGRAKLNSLENCQHKGLAPGDVATRRWTYIYIYTHIVQWSLADIFSPMALSDSFCGWCMLMFEVGFVECFLGGCHGWSSWSVDDFHQTVMIGILIYQQIPRIFQYMFVFLTGVHAKRHPSYDFVRCWNNRFIYSIAVGLLRRGSLIHGVWFNGKTSGNHAILCPGNWTQLLQMAFEHSRLFACRIHMMIFLCKLW